MNKEQMRRGKKDPNNSFAQIRKRFKLKTPQGKKQKNEKEKDKNASGVTSLVSSLNGVSGSGLASSAISGDGNLSSSQQTKEVSFHDGLSSSYHDHLSSSQVKKDDEDDDDNEEEEMDEET